MKYIIATHGNMASGIKNTIEMLRGKRQDVYAVDAYVEDQEFSETLQNMVNSIEDSYIYIFTDIVSGSVNQTVSHMLNDCRIHLITGINLPVIIECILRNKEMSDEEIMAVVEEARQHLIYMNSVC